MECNERLTGLLRAYFLLSNPNETPCEEIIYGLFSVVIIQLHMKLYTFYFDLFCKEIILYQVFDNPGYRNHILCALAKKVTGKFSQFTDVKLWVSKQICQGCTEEYHQCNSTRRNDSLLVKKGDCTGEGKNSAKGLQKYLPWDWR
tara:strand:+ start:193 stop:627 length:435 start_codon:yes stop_codon:yes gene_type:complete